MDEQPDLERDVSEVRAELRAHTSVIHALRQSQLDMAQVLDHHTQVLDHHTQKLEQHDRMFQEVQHGVDRIIAILDADDGPPLGRQSSKSVAGRAKDSPPPPGTSTSSPARAKAARSWAAWRRSVPASRA